MRAWHAASYQLWHGAGGRVCDSSGSTSWTFISIATSAAKNAAISPGCSWIISRAVFTNSRKVKTPSVLWLSRRLQKSSAWVLVSCLSAWCASGAGTDRDMIGPLLSGESATRVSAFPGAGDFWSLGQTLLSARSMPAHVCRSIAGSTIDCSC